MLLSAVSFLEEYEVQVMNGAVEFQLEMKLKEREEADRREEERRLFVEEVWKRFDPTPQGFSSVIGEETCGVPTAPGHPGSQPRRECPQIELDVARRPRYPSNRSPISRLTTVFLMSSCDSYQVLRGQ